MTAPSVSAYLATLALELRKCGVVASNFVNEARDHLLDAVESGERRGMSPDAAEREAVVRFGDPRVVAAAYAAQALRTLHLLLLMLGLAIGMAIAYVDSRPHWDDTGVTAFTLLIASGILGVIAPQRPWRWALAIGVWIPLYLLLRTPTLGTLGGGLVILAFPMAGAYAGMLVRRTITVN